MSYLSFKLNYCSHFSSFGGKMWLYWVCRCILNLMIYICSQTSPIKKSPFSCHRKLNLSLKTTFSLSERWPLNTGLTVVIAAMLDSWWDHHLRSFRRTNYKIVHPFVRRRMPSNGKSSLDPLGHVSFKGNNLIT
jgi:hypothetical protein